MSYREPFGENKQQTDKNNCEELEDGERLAELLAQEPEAPGTPDTAALEVIIITTIMISSSTNDDHYYYIIYTQQRT